MSHIPSASYKIIKYIIFLPSIMGGLTNSVTDIHVEKAVVSTKFKVYTSLVGDGLVTLYANN